ncbi:MAG TPA: CbiX/SirB N-terminal domain-containing protein [Bryobacteraceae bacterium]|nr:CbiX/SirB N-terminal domain-containing protein [Bryobacteraceae bacterium]
MPVTAIVIFAHGSSIESANDSVRRIADSVRREAGFELVETAFLEQGRPDLGGAIEAAVAQGARRVVVVPYFLTLGLHLQRDLPNIVSGLAGLHKGVEIRVALPLDGHPALGDILKQRALEVLSAEKAG